VRQQIEEAAFMSQMQPRLREYLAKLRQNAYIDVRPGYVDTAAVRNSSKPLYSAYTPPGPKKKVHFKRTRYTGAHRGRHAGDTTTEAATNKAGTAGASETAATGTATTGTATTGTAATGTATKPTAGGTTTALASTPAVEKPGKKEKIRFGQAPREALPPAAHPTEQTAGTGTGNEAQVASNSASTDIPGTDTTAAAERKTRFSDRARLPKTKKAKTPDQVENERVAQQATPDEAAAEKTQSAPLGLAGDTATKKKAPKVKGEKTRFSDQANKTKQAEPPPPQTSTPSPLATPGTVPTPADSASPDNGTAPAPTQPQP
jgi:peptidyl-prolyl cis-trans isomerase SurA